MTGLRRALWALGVAGFIAGAIPLVLALSAPDHINDRALTAVFGPLIGWSFIGTGLFAWYRRPENNFGALMAAVGFTWCISGLLVDGHPGVFIVGLIVNPLPFALLFHMLMAFPTGRLETRVARGSALLGYFVTTLLWWVALLFYDTRPDNWASNPLLAFDDQRVADALFSVQSLLAIAALVGVVVALRQRWMRSSRTQRQVLVPVYAAAVVLAALLSLSLVADVTPVPDGLEWAVDVAGLVSLMMVPFAFLGGLLRMRLTRAGAVSELVARLSEGPDRRRGLRDALADALGDPGLTLAYWIPARDEYVSASGHPMELPDPGSDRVATIVHDHGAPVAAIVHDALLDDERELIDAVAAAASITLENERLGAELRAKIEELSEQRRRGVVAALEERRRLERNLHDGAQQRLVSMALKLRLARGRLDDPERADRMLADAAAELDSALEELRELARGIHPAVLSDRGLGPALQSLAGRSPVPVEVEATPGERLPEAVELAAYFVVAEALTNVAKYSSATKAFVRAVRDHGHVLVEVSDDGVGGADPSRGSGLDGLADRLYAVGGRLEVMDGRGGGTVVRADIPC